MASISSLYLLLCGFELACGLEINFNRSLIYHLDEEEVAHELVADMLNCQKGRFHLMYLRVLLRPTKLHHDNWHSLIAKVDSRLA